MLDKYLVSEVTSFCLPLYFPGMGSTLAGYYERHVKGPHNWQKNKLRERSYCDREQEASSCSGTPQLLQ